MLDLGQYLLRFQLLYGVPPRPETEAERAFIVTLRPSDRKRSLGKKKNAARLGAAVQLCSSH